MGEAFEKSKPLTRMTRINADFLGLVLPELSSIGCGECLESDLSG